MAAISAEKSKKTKSDKFLKSVLRNYELYLFLVPALVFIAVFMYTPMFGVIIAFKKYNFNLGIIGSPWVGFKHFQSFFNSHMFITVIKNTLGLSLYYLAATFPIPIIFALLINNARSKFFKSTVQMVTYAPNFISVVVVVGIINVVLAPDTGIVNIVLKSLGYESVYFLGNKDFFRSIYVWSGVWQIMGWSSVIYIASLSSIGSELYEAAVVDGASRLQKILFIELPSLLPTTMIVLILNAGLIMNLGFEKVYLMQNPVNLSISEIITTHVYKKGIIDGSLELAAAIGLFNSVINFILILTVNKISKQVTDSSLF